ncbi:hypothetical protein POM88_003134 [Heracleum sosnowskyi]|uniref:Uncharacterized protein n=1 Tax=Heracleum sosnowskyi TaxID=360622 RepID=A0AAD8JHF3_9APIA|nr:hypothetical protein POM88_003134 [Heracleum sosnowskyi]
MMNRLQVYLAIRYSATRRCGSAMCLGLERKFHLMVINLICCSSFNCDHFAEMDSSGLRIPSDFCSKYGNRLPASFHVILRNGYRLPVDFDQRRGILKGTTCSEIEYPHIVHHLQTCHPRRVTLGNSGWRFVFFVDPTVSLVDKIEPSTTFIERCGSTFPIWPRIALNNGKVFCGTYSRQTDDGVGMVNVSVFDENLFEVVFPGSPTSIDETSQAFDIASGFEITIQPC